MISTEEVIDRSNEITKLGLEIKKAKDEQLEYFKKAEEAAERVKSLNIERSELVAALITDCNKSITINDLD